MDKQQDKQDKCPDYVDVGTDDVDFPVELLGGVWDTWAVVDNRRQYVPVKF